MATLKDHGLKVIYVAEKEVPIFDRTYAAGEIIENAEQCPNLPWLMSQHIVRRETVPENGPVVELGSAEVTPTKKKAPAKKKSSTRRKSA